MQNQGNGHAYVGLKKFAPPNHSFFARLCARARALLTAVDYAHFTFLEAAGTRAWGREWGWIDQQATIDRSVSTKVQKGNIVDFGVPTFNGFWLGWGSIAPRCK